MSALKVLQTQFQMFINSRFYLDDEYVDMIRNKFLQYTRLAIPEFLIIESNGTESKEQDTSSRSGNDAHVDDADIRPIYDEEPMAEVDQNAEQCHDIRPLPAKLTDDMQLTFRSTLESENCQNGFTKDESFKMMSDHNSSDLVPQRQEMSVENVSSGLVPQGQKALDYDNSDPVPPR
ncbi:hypothetical protein Tco_1418786 [Tanacetum coccineum]